MAVVVDNMSVKVIMSTMNIEALATVVSDVSSLSCVPLHFLSIVSSKCSHASNNIDVETLSSLVSKSKLSLVESSDAVSSGIEGEPLSVVIWVVILDSKSVLLCSNILGVEECSSFLHSASNLELNSGSKWLLWIVNSLSVDGPCLVSTVVALVPDGVSVVVVVSTVDIEASETNVSNVSLFTVHPSNLLKVLLNEWSDNSWVQPMEPVSGTDWK